MLLSVIFIVIVIGVVVGLLFYFDVFNINSEKKNAKMVMGEMDEMDDDYFQKLN